MPERPALLWSGLALDVVMNLAPHIGGHAAVTARPDMNEPGGGILLGWRIGLGFEAKHPSQRTLVAHKSANAAAETHR